MPNRQKTHTNTRTPNESCIGLLRPFGLTKHVEKKTLHEPSGNKQATAGDTPDDGLIEARNM